MDSFRGYQKESGMSCLSSFLLTDEGLPGYPAPRYDMRVVWNPPHAPVMDSGELISMGSRPWWRRHAMIAPWNGALIEAYESWVYAMKDQS